MSTANPIENCIKAFCGEPLQRSGTPKNLSVAAGVPPAVEAGLLPSGKNRSLGGNARFYQVDCEATLFPPGGTRRLYGSQDGRRYHFQTRSKIILSLMVAVSLIAPASVSPAGTVSPQLLSTRSSSVIPSAGGDGDSCGATVSPDGRFVVFSSAANDLAPADDRQFYMNVYLHDRASNTTALASVSLDGIRGGNANSLGDQVSTNGQFVLFESDAGNLVAGSTSWIGNIYVRDMQAQTTRLASVATNGSVANGQSYDAVMTPDGRYVAFVSDASNLVPGDNNSLPDVFVRDMVLNTTTLVSVGATQSGSVMATPRMTPDGRYITFFSTAKGMVAGAGLSGEGEIYLRDLVAGTTTWASAGGPNIIQSVFGPANGASLLFRHPSMSDDGRYIAFQGGTNGVGRTLVLLSDQVAGTTSIVATNALGAFPTDDNRYGPEMTPDGRFIAYVQAESGGTNSDVFVRDTLAGTNILVSSDQGGLPANAISDSPAVTFNGQLVAFLSNATNLVGNAVSPGFHVYLRDLQAGTTQLADADTNGVGSSNVEGACPSLSADGQMLVFNAPDGELVSGDSNKALDVFAFDRFTGMNELVSAKDPTVVSEVGDALTRMSPYSISGDGRWAVFESFADDLVPNDANGHCDVFARDLWTGQTTLVSAGLDGNPALGGNSDSAVISASGRYVAFASAATNLTADSVTNINIFRRDLLAGTTILLNAGTNAALTAMTNCSAPVISADGRHVAFSSTAKTGSGSIAPTGTFWRDVNSSAAVRLAAGGSIFPPSMSADGRYVAYSTNTQLRIRDTQLGQDIYTNSTMIISAAISPDGNRVLYCTNGSYPHPIWVKVDQIAPQSNLLSFASTVPVQSSGQWSSDGRYVAFVGVTNLPSDKNKIYLCDLATRNVTLVSHNATNSGDPNGPSDMPAISGDGQFVVYRSYGTDIVAGDTNPAPKIFLFDRLTGANSILSAAQNNSGPFPWISAPVISAGAENVAFVSVGSDLVTNDFNRVSDAFAIRVLMRMQIAATPAPGASTTLTWQTVPERNYQIQYRDELADPQWHDLSANISIAGSMGSATVPADQASRFYRVVETQ